MKWVGITGNIGSGKSSVANLLTKRNYTVIDADKLVRQFYLDQSPEKVNLIKYFGKSILDSNSHIDKKKLSEIVFNDPIKLDKLESFIHPYIKKQTQKIKKQCLDNNEEICFYDVPLLFEKNMNKEFDIVIVVYAKKEIRKKRAMLRSGWSSEEFDLRDSNQISMEVKEKKADYVFYNNDSLVALEKQIDDFIIKMKSVV
jgi:dephospho-CoA kinase